MGREHDRAPPRPVSNARWRHLQRRARPSRSPRRRADCPWSRVDREDIVLTSAAACSNPLAHRTSKNAAISGLIKVPHNVTTKPISVSETILLCQNKKPLNALGKTSAKERRHRRKPANLCGKRWSIFARGNMARVPPSKPSLLDCPKHDEPESNFRHRK